MSDGTVVEPVESRIMLRRAPRRWWLFALLAAVPLAIVALVYVIACWRAHAILQQAMNEIAERGEPVRFADLAPPADDKALARGKAIAPLINKLERVPWELLDQTATQPLTDALATSAQREMGLNHRQRLISARLGLAVCRHRHRHGHLPESLDNLESSPIRNPTGLLSGKPLVYQKTTDGLAIYDDVPEQGRFEVKFVGAE